MKLVLDVENTVTEREGKLHLDPFESDNSLIMVGALTESGDEYLYRMDEDTSYFNKIQELLDKTTVLIGHNIVHDLMWLWESNFKYNGDVFDKGKRTLGMGLNNQRFVNNVSNLINQVRRRRPRPTTN